MIIRKKVESNKRSACAWNSSSITGISFGVTDYGPCLGYIDSDENGDVTIFICKDKCDDAGVKIKEI